MKRWIHAASKVTKTIAVNKLRKGIVNRDYLREVELPEKWMSQIEDQFHDYYQFTSVRNYADNHNIDYDDLRMIDGHYIIDTKGHIDFASLEDNEDMSDVIYQSIRDCLREVSEMIVSDLRSYDSDPYVVGARVVLDIYGYGNYKLSLRDRVLVISGKANPEKKSLCSEGYGVTVLSSKEDLCYLGLLGAIANNTDFKRRQVPRIVKILSEPLQNL